MNSENIPWADEVGSLLKELGFVLKHMNLFRPQILKLWLDCFYSNLSKCGTRVNEAQSSKLL